MKLNGKTGIVLAFVIGLAVVLSACEPQPSGLAIESTFSVKGPFLTISKKVTGYTIFYPKNLEGDHPIITWGNGTYAPTLSYRPLLSHLASWGFVVIASDSLMTQSGDDLVAGIDYLIELNATAGSEFYGMLDTDNVGTAGHSQGGGGAINAAKDPRVTCSVPIAPSPGKIAHVACPIFLVAGLADTIVSSVLVHLTSYVRSTCPTVFGIIDKMSHLSFIGNAGAIRGYLTAWFMYHLQGDMYAGMAFTGDCEICGNINWDVKMKHF
jgi:dienelactone hydrolase